MSYDALQAFVATKNAYARERGGNTATGIYYATKIVPKTTYGDVITFGTLFLDATSTAGCLKRLAAGDSKGWEYVQESNNCVFVKTTSFTRAISRWMQYFPWSRDTGWALRMNEEYPWNAEFWAYGLEYAIARGGAGEVPGSFAMKMSSVKDAIVNLPNVPGQVLTYLKDNIPNLPGLPDLTKWAEIIKWGSIGGGLYILYKYVLAPKKS